MGTLTNLLRDYRGASAAEYAMILALVGAAIAMAAVTLSGAIATGMSNTASCIDDKSTC